MVIRHSSLCTDYLLPLGLSLCGSGSSPNAIIWTKIDFSLTVARLFYTAPRFCLRFFEDPFAAFYTAISVLASLPVRIWSAFSGGSLISALKIGRGRAQFPPPAASFFSMFFTYGSLVAMATKAYSLSFPTTVGFFVFSIYLGMSLFHKYVLLRSVSATMLRRADRSSLSHVKFSPVPVKVPPTHWAPLRHAMRSPALPPVAPIESRWGLLNIVFLPTAPFPVKRDPCSRYPTEIRQRPILQEKRGKPQ